MGKVNPNKRIQRRRTEAEMRNALSSLTSMRVHTSPPDVDDDEIVIQDVIEELLESRQALEEIKAFVQTWQAKFSRK